MSLLQFSDIQKHYGAFHALKGVSLTLEPGAIGLLGPNGAGKSTLLKVMLGLLPFDGSATVLGFDVRSDARKLRARVGYMPERDCYLPGMNAVELCTYAAELSGLPAAEAMQRAHSVLEFVGLGDKRYQRIDGYSTGMKQRVKLAQALVHDPRLLLLDEPTNGLDPDGRDEMLALIERTGREFGIAVLVTSHLLGEIERVCDFLIAIDAGRLKYAGPVSRFTEKTERLVLELDDDVPEFAAGLRERGLTVEGNGHELRVALVDDATYDIVRDLAAELEA